MNYGLIRKTFSDSAFVLALSFTALMAFECAFVAAIGQNPVTVQIRHGIPPIARELLKAAMGADIADIMTETGVISISFIHPFLQLVLWAYSLAFCTRIIVGEIDRGTADLLMSLPIGRTSMYLSLTFVWLVCGAVLCVAPFLGLWISQRVMHRNPYDMARLWMVIVNMFCLFLAVGAGTLMLSAMSSRRGRTIGAVATVLLASFALNFLALLWEWLKKISFLGVLEYYRPLIIVKDGQWPVRDMSVLLGAAAAFWITGLVVFRRRDVRTG